MSNIIKTVYSTNQFNDFFRVNYLTDRFNSDILVNVACYLLNVLKEFG